MNPNRKDNFHNNKYKNYSNIFIKSKVFSSIIKGKLSEKNQKVLIGYEKFCQQLSYLYFRFKNSSNIIYFKEEKKQLIIYKLYNF